jgi:hypothetical protein
MNIEKFPSIEQKIETEDKKERYERLIENIEKISLLYAAKKFKEKNEHNDAYLFSQAVQEFTPTKNVVENPINFLSEFDYSGNKEKLDAFFVDIFSEIDKIYNPQENNVEDVFSFIISQRNNIKKYFSVENLENKENKNRDKNVKIFRFNELNGAFSDNNNRYNILEKYGFSKFSTFLELHVINVYESDDSKLGLKLIENDFNEIAKYIVDSKPNVAAVVGRSWLLDTPLSDRLGFNKIEQENQKEESSLNDFSTWIQFIDKDGEMSQGRLKKLLEKGELPHRSVLAYMPVEDFLQKYLPVEKRGKLTLKKLDEEKNKFWQNLKLESLAAKDLWNKTIKEGGDFNSFISNQESLNKILLFLKPESRSAYLDFMKQMFDESVEWKNFYKYKSDEIKAIDAELKEAQIKDLYKDYEVEIS